MTILIQCLALLEKVPEATEVGRNRWYTSANFFTISDWLHCSLLSYLGIEKFYETRNDGYSPSSNIRSQRKVGKYYISLTIVQKWFKWHCKFAIITCSTFLCQCIVIAVYSHCWHLKLLHLYIGTLSGWFWNVFRNALALFFRIGNREEMKSKLVRQYWIFCAIYLITVLLVITFEYASTIKLYST